MTASLKKMDDLLTFRILSKLEHESQLIITETNCSTVPPELIQHLTCVYALQPAFLAMIHYFQHQHI